MKIINAVKSNPGLKKWVLRLLMPRNQARPRVWVKWFVNPFFHQRGKRALVRRRVRLDVMPFNRFILGRDSTIEDFCTINNGVGEVVIGERVRIGISTVLIGPIQIGNDVGLGQHVVASALNHGYQDISRSIFVQPVITAPIRIEDEAWIGANAVLVAGIRIGKHSVVAAGSVVTKDVPDYSVVAGNPARIIKRYNQQTQKWERIR
jgi:acetyltransferase-like isoleucine patch superfamily enzyme